MLLSSCNHTDYNLDQQQILNFNDNISTLESNNSINDTETPQKELNLLETAINDGFLIAQDENTQEYVVMGYCGDETEITIPRVATIIGSKAFVDNNSIKVINIPNHVEKIMFGAFNDCSSLTQIYIPSSVQSIVNPFMYCDSVTIYVKENSYAEEWVQNYNFSLEELNLTVDTLDVDYF